MQPSTTACTFALASSVIKVLSLRWLSRTTRPAASSSKMMRSTSRIHSASIGASAMPRVSRRLRMKVSVMVKRVPSSATRVRRSATSWSAVQSPMWSTGTSTFAATAS